MKAIVVIGLARSGKDTVAEYLQQKYGYTKLVFSDLIAEELKKRGMQVNKKNMSEIANVLREEQGMDILAKLIVEKMKEAGKEKFVLVGPRSPQELEYVKKKYEKCIAIKVESERSKRFERRSKKDPNKAEEFFA